MTSRLQSIHHAGVIIFGSVDLLLGILLLSGPALLSGLAAIPFPEELFWIRVIGLLQVGLAAAYILGGVHPQLHRGNIVLAAVMRLAMAVLLIATGVARPAFRLLVFLGAVEVPIGLSHAIYAAKLSQARE